MSRSVCFMKMIEKFFRLIIASIIVSIPFIHLSFAQKNDTISSKSDTIPSKRRIIHPGFNYHLQLNHLDLSPIINIEIFSRLHVGAGANFLYYYKSDSYRNKNTAFGVNAYARYFFVPNVFIHGEYLFGKAPYLYPMLNETRSVRDVSILTGLGYKQPFTDSIDGYFFILADLNNSEQSIYKNKILFKAGITF